MISTEHSMISVTRASVVCGFFAACLVAVAIAGTTPEGKEWLAKKETEDGVKKTDSGLLYKVLKSGSEGAKQPKIDTPCECHYRGTLIDGREFDSSYSRGMPATFAPNQVIKGWTEAMQMMKEGDHWELYIPSELAYGDANRSVGTLALVCSEPFFWNQLPLTLRTEEALSLPGRSLFLSWKFSRSRTERSLCARFPPALHHPSICAAKQMFKKRHLHLFSLRRLMFLR